VDDIVLGHVAPMVEARVEVDPHRPRLGAAADIAGEQDEGLGPSRVRAGFGDEIVELD
jgi:hypothetical protein